MTNQEELKLIESIVLGKKTDFEILIKPYFSKIYNITYRILNNEDDAKDASQDAIIKIYKNLASFNGKSKFSTWIYRICVNSANDLIRKRAKDRAISLDNEIETSGDGILIGKNSIDGNPEKKLEQKELHNEILKSISELDESHRDLIVLRDLQGLSYSEIADIVDKNVGSVKSGINRARKKLAEKLILKGIKPSNYERRVSDEL